MCGRAWCRVSLRPPSCLCTCRPRRPRHRARGEGWGSWARPPCAEATDVPACSPCLARDRAHGAGALRTPGRVQCSARSPRGASPPAPALSRRGPARPQIWVSSPHNATGYYTVHGEEALHADHFSARLSFGDTQTTWARTGYLGFLRRTELTDASGGQHCAVRPRPRGVLRLGPPASPPTGPREARILARGAGCADGGVLWRLLSPRGCPSLPSRARPLPRMWGRWPEAVMCSSGRAASWAQHRRQPLRTRPAGPVSTSVARRCCLRWEMPKGSGSRRRHV